VAALFHLSSSMGRRLEDLRAHEASPELGELLDGAMRTVHEGLGDQNIHVYAEACRAVTAVVPTFCGAVDGRLLVAHLAPLLRQLCSRMGDSKEAARTHTTQALFRLLRPPVGDIVTPMAIAGLILRHLMPNKDDDAAAQSPFPAAPKAGRGAVVGWLCRIGALRDLVKEYPKKIVTQPGSTHPGEWLRLKDGLVHSDPDVRHEVARLYALVCKAHLRTSGDAEAQVLGREAWVAALQDLPPKGNAQLRKLLKLPERSQQSDSSPKKARNPTVPWEVPRSLAEWAQCSQETLAALRAPGRGEEQAALTALRALGHAVIGEPGKHGGPPTEEAFAGICRAIQHVLGSEVGGDRGIFKCSVDLCHASVDKLAPFLSGLDINMGLGKAFPVLLERASSGSVKLAVASDKLVQQLAKHPKIGCEAVTKMVISAIGRADNAEMLTRPTMLLHTLLGEYGLRLCAQRDIITLLLCALGGQMERLQQQSEVDLVRPQLIGVLGTVNRFSQETVHRCLGEVEPAQRKLLMAALSEAPDPKLVALGASAVEQELLEGPTVAGSAIRAASRGRENSPRPEGRLGESPSRRQLVAGLAPLPPRTVPPGLPRGPAGSPPLTRMLSREDLRREDKEASPGGTEATPTRSRRHRDRPPRHSSGSPGPTFGIDSGTSTAVSTACPSQQSTESNVSRWGGDPSGKPPAPTMLSSGRGARGRGPDSWSFKENENGAGETRPRLSGTADACFIKGKEEKSESMASLMNALSNMDAGWKTK